MNVVVLAKYVPSPQGTPELGGDGLLVREGVEGALDPGDEYAVEAALRIVEANEGEVCVVSMGPHDAMSAVRRALAMGADRGVLVSDQQLRGADALVTARVLSGAISRSAFDLVISGVESTDGYTGTLPSTVAEMLDLPSVTFARKLEVGGGTIRAERQSETGYDVVECDLPALVTVTSGSDEPRYPSLKGIMSAKTKPVDVISTSDLGLGPDQLSASQRVDGVADAGAKQTGEVVQAGPETLARIADLLQEAKAI